ncbi:hypothetical protein LTR86_011308, partial [Recurvomyces mirabilis]
MINTVYQPLPPTKHIDIMVQATAAATPPAKSPPATTAISASNPSAQAKRSNCHLWNAHHAQKQDPSTIPAAADSKEITPGPLLRCRSSITERMVGLLPHYDGHKHPSLSDSGPMIVEEDAKT